MFQGYVRHIRYLRSRNGGFCWLFVEYNIAFEWRIPLQTIGLVMREGGVIELLNVSATVSEM